MKKIITLLFFLLFSKVTFAQNLCDASCNLTITFPDGGSITATESMTLFFGDGGLVDTVTTTTAYLNGNTLVLGAGEALSFGAGGSLDLGAGGNIDYTNIAIVTTGDVTIEAVGGAGAIAIMNMSLTAGSITLNTDTTIEGTLSLSGDMTVGGTGLIVSTGDLEIVSGTTTIDVNVDLSNGTITSDSGSLTVSDSGSLTLSGGQIIVDASLSAIEVNNTNTTVGVGAITLLTEITIDNVLYESDDGLVFKDPAGLTGHLEFENGEFVFIPDVVEEASDSGASDLLLIFGLLFALTVFRRRQATGFFIR